MKTTTDLAAAILAAAMESNIEPEPETAERPRVYTVPEAAEELRCGTTMIYELIRDGRLSSIKLGRRRLIPASAIDALIEGGAE